MIKPAKAAIVAICLLVLTFAAILADDLLAEEVTEDADFGQGSDAAWFTREIDGRPGLPAVGYLLTGYLDSVGCRRYDFTVTGPIDPEPVTRLPGQPIAHTADGGDPLLAVDPAVRPHFRASRLQ